MEYAFPLEDDGRELPEDDAAFRASFRRRLRLKGLDQKYAEADVGHIFSRHGTHTSCRHNAFMQDRRWNRLAGDNYDELNCAFSGALRCQHAFDACLDRGDLSEGRWAGWQPEAIRAQGHAEFREMGLYTRLEGGFDPTSPAMNDGRVHFDGFGRPVGVDSLIKDYQKAGLLLRKSAFKLQLSGSNYTQINRVSGLW